MILFYNKINPSIYQNLSQKRLGHDAIDKGNVVYAEKLAVAITNEMNANNGL